MKIKKLVIIFALIAALSAAFLCGCTEEGEESSTEVTTEATAAN